MKRLIVGFAAFSALIILCCVPVCLAASSDEALQAMEHAESELASAYVAVAEAHDAGANVSELVGRLELAGAWLTSARNAYRVEEYDESYSHAVNCNASVNGIVYEASILKGDAQRSYYEGMFLTAAFSGVGLCILLISSLLGWRLFKKRYIKRVLEMKPKVGE